jgi:hypothetical protein
VANQLATNNAIKVLKYRLETPENLGPGSSIYQYNTQHSGNAEYFTVTISDQGYTSSTDEARLAVERLDVVVVAVNDAPVISVPQDLLGREDELVDVVGVSVFDWDVNETITSPLAQLVEAPPTQKVKGFNGGGLLMSSKRDPAWKQM